MAGGTTDPPTPGLQLHIFAVSGSLEPGAHHKGFGLLLRMHKLYVNTEQEQDAHSEAV